MRRAAQHGDTVRSDGAEAQEARGRDHRAARGSSRLSLQAGSGWESLAPRLSPIFQEVKRMRFEFIGGELAVHHHDCPCPDCGLDREVDSVFIASGMVSSAVALETERIILAVVGE